MPASTFAVDSVEIGVKVPKSVSINESAQVVQQFWAERNSKEAPLEFETGNVNHEELVSPSPHMPNAFLSTIITAYNEHLPLIFTPDDFWLLISLGVSQFLGQEENAEKYRETFVDHQGKMDLVVDGVPLGIHPKSGDGNKKGWPLFVTEIVKLIKKNTKTDTARVMTEHFTTTGEVEGTAFEVSLMEAMKNYFQYTCMLACGIPEVTLEGDAEDYLSIIDRIDALISLLPTFEWYLTRVKAHMQKVLVSKRGNPDIEWWKRMILKTPVGSGGQTTLTGWVSDFFPFQYDHEGKPCANTRPEAEFTDFQSPAVTFTPVKLIDALYTMKTYDMKLVGGFVGTAKAKTNDGKMALRPAIGWLMFYWTEQTL